jgi:hypothetical protein
MVLLAASGTGPLQAICSPYRIVIETVSVELATGSVVVASVEELCSPSEAIESVVNPKELSSVFISGFGTGA